MCINVMLKVKVDSAVSLVQVVGGGASMPVCIPHQSVLIEKVHPPP